MYFLLSLELSSGKFAVSVYVLRVNSNGGRVSRININKYIFTYLQHFSLYRKT